MRLICPICQNAFDRRPAHIKGKTVCCSYACSHKAARRQKKRATILHATCKNCGKTFQKELGRTRQSGPHYCGRKCQSTASVLKRWQNHIPKSPRNWSTVKATIEAVKRIGKCEKCGGTDNLHGHHKVPHSQDPSLGSDPQNIQVLCRPCHALEHPEYAAVIMFPHQKTGGEISCLQCGKLRYVPPYLLRIAKYCGDDCRMTALNSRKKNHSDNPCR